MGSSWTSIIGQALGGVGSGIQGYASSAVTEAQGQIALRQFVYSAAVDDANADVLSLVTQRDLGRMREEGEGEISAQKARIGASGLTSESFGLLTAEGVENLEQDILDLNVERSTQIFNLRTSARFNRLQGLAAMEGANTEAELGRVGTAFSMLGGAASSAGSAFGSGRN